MTDFIYLQDSLKSTNKSNIKVVYNNLLNIKNAKLKQELVICNVDRDYQEKTISFLLEENNKLRNNLRSINNRLDMIEDYSHKLFLENKILERKIEEDIYKNSYS